MMILSLLLLLLLSPFMVSAHNNYRKAILPVSPPLSLSSGTMPLQFSRVAGFDFVLFSAQANKGLKMTGLVRLMEGLLMGLDGKSDPRRSVADEAR